MTCRGPATKNILMSHLIQTLYELRNTTFPGASVDQIWNLFDQLYPNTSTYDTIVRTLRQGSRQGIFTRCEFPAYSNIYYYMFDPMMTYRNWSNRQYGLPIIMDKNPGGGAPCGCVNMPLGAQCNSRGQAGPNNQDCCLPNPDLLTNSSLSSRIAAANARKGTCCNQ
jgi:hypothetical protein